MEWNITKSGRVCSHCDRALDEQERFIATLIFEEAAFVRRDYCAACWDSARPEVFSFWRTEIPKKEEDAKRMVNAQVLLDIFQRLETETDREKLNFRFLLGLILLRKKLFKLSETRFQNGDEYLILNQPKEDRVHEVLNPRMTDEETETVREQLAQVFEADFSSIE